MKIYQISIIFDASFGHHLKINYVTQFEHLKQFETNDSCVKI